MDLDYPILYPQHRSRRRLHRLDKFQTRLQIPIEQKAGITCCRIHYQVRRQLECLEENLQENC